MNEVLPAVCFFLIFGELDKHVVNGPLSQPLLCFVPDAIWLLEC